MLPNRQENADLVTFPEKILNGKLHFFVQRKLVTRDIKLQKQGPKLFYQKRCS